MQTFRRLALFLAVNLLVILTLSFLLHLFGVQPYLTPYGLDYNSLLAFCFIWGMGGALISLSLSRIMAKWLMSVRVIDPSSTDLAEQKLVQMVYRLCRKAGLPDMPEVGIFQSPAMNAFATGPTKSRSLVALSSGIIARMHEDELEAVIAHEVSHIANGDMVTMTLLQGVINAFVMFFARILAFAITRGSNSNRRSSSPFAYYALVFVFEIVFMVLGSIVVCAYSRFREFRADKGGADLAGKAKMIAALRALQNEHESSSSMPMKQTAIQAMMIKNKSGGFLTLFATHPPLDERIARLSR